MELFTRYGSPVTGKIIEQGTRRFTMVPRKCSRCGGAGGADKWAHTGWTCFDCNGKGTHPNGPERVPVYTAEKLAKLNEAKAKRDAKKRAAAEAKAAAERAAADARREAFMAAHSALLAECEPYCERSEFVRDVVGKARERCEISEKQEAALRASVAKMAAEDARRAATTFTGTVGERLRGLRVTVARVFEYDNGPGAYPNRFFYITTLISDEGQSFVIKSSSFRVRKGSKLVITGTVKDHSSYRDEKQTQLARVKIDEVIETPPEEKEDY